MKAVASTGFGALYVLDILDGHVHENEQKIRARAAKMNALASVPDMRGTDLPPLQLGSGYPHILISFIYDKKQDFFEQRLGYRPRTWMGDSGAFTLWVAESGTVDIDEYASWCSYYTNLNPDFVTVSLDVIPGTPTRHADEREKKKAMRQSLKNGDFLREAGLKITEVFHMGEPTSYLDQLLERRQPGEILALGGLAGKHGINHKIAFCDLVFARLRDRFGWDALPPFHGFGISPTSRLCRRYPWFSVDSSSWASPGLYAYQPNRRGGRLGSDGRTSSYAMRTFYLRQMLDAWQREEQALTRLWSSRGVRFMDMSKEPA